MDILTVVECHDAFAGSVRATSANSCRTCGGNLAAPRRPCTCPTLAAEPLARTSVDPGCPTHGAR